MQESSQCSSQAYLPIISEVLSEGKEKKAMVQPDWNTAQPALGVPIWSSESMQNRPYATDGQQATYEAGTGNFVQNCDKPVAGVPTDVWSLLDFQETKNFEVKKKKKLKSFAPFLLFAELLRDIDCMNCAASSMHLLQITLQFLFASNAISLISSSRVLMSSLLPGRSFQHFKGPISLRRTFLTRIRTRTIFVSLPMNSPFESSRG